MRVLFVESQAQLGGPGFALLTMLENLDRSVVEPVYVSLTPQGGEMQPRVEALGLPAYHLPTGRFRQLGQTRRVIFALKELILKERIDLVFTNSGHPLLFGRPAAILTGRPCVWWVHGYFPHDLLRGHAIALGQLLLSADALFANSEYTAGMLRQDFPYGPRIRVVRYGVDLQKFQPDPGRGATARRGLGIRPDERIVGMFARLHPFKGQDVLLRSAALLKSRGIACRFLLVGSPLLGLEVSYVDRLQELVRKAGLNEQVCFTGQRNDINDLMNACDVLVHASVEPEPWGLAVAEGMAAGRPTVSSAGGGPSEMIEPGRTGLLVPREDPAALAAALEEVLVRPEWSREMGKAARLHAVREYDPRHAASVLCGELQDVFWVRGSANGN